MKDTYSESVRQNKNLQSIIFESKRVIWAFDQNERLKFESERKFEVLMWKTIKFQ
jgi:hypothetical protein